MDQLIDDIHQFDQGETTEEDLHTFIGRKSHYYVDKWKKIQSGKTVSFNWAAFLIAGPWLIYRKMYLVAAIFFIGNYAFDTALEFIMVDLMDGATDAYYSITRITNLAIPAGFALAANWLYLNHAEKQIQKIKEETSPGNLPETLKQKGNPTWIDVVLGISVTLIYISFSLREELMELFQ